MRLARRKRLCPQHRFMWVAPLWLVAVLALLLMVPSYGLSLLALPLLFAWQRRRTRRRIAEWALDLRER